MSVMFLFLIEFPDKMILQVQHVAYMPIIDSYMLANPPTEGKLFEPHFDIACYLQMDQKCRSTFW